MKATAEASDRPSHCPWAERLHLHDPVVKVQFGFKTRPLRDGGGKTSPGRMPPHLRPASPLASLGEAILDIVRPHVPAFLDSIAIPCKTHPFPTQVLEEARKLMHTHDPECAPGQPFYLGLVQHLATVAGDADAAFPSVLATGVPLGVESPTLTSPGIWPTKDELRGEDLEPSHLPPPSGRNNYESAEALADRVEETFFEERDLDMVEGPFSAQEAADRCACQPEELCPGPLAAIDEGDKIRTIYDGSWGGANAHIQNNTAEKTTAPTVGDCVHAIHWIKAVGGGPPSTGALGPEAGASPIPRSSWRWPAEDPHLCILKADVTKAHRRIKVLPSEWKYQVAQLRGKWWINKVGTYGMASAQLYWGRMAALILRILYGMFPMVDWSFVFVDDFCWILRGENAKIQAAALMLAMLAMGVPLSWKKTVLGDVNTWLGFVVDPTGPTIRMAEQKHDIVMVILMDLAEGKTFTSKEIEKAMGRLQWATSACPLAKPFLQPFWQWKAVVHTCGRPSKLVRSFALFLYKLFEKPFVQASPFIPLTSWHGASDAGAAKNGPCFVGGWLSNLDTPAKGDVWWFHHEVKAEKHPWAFKSGDPQKRIAALEMMGTLLLVYFLIQKGSRGSARVMIPMVSDNQGNIYAILNQKTRKMPTALLLMELVLQLHFFQCQVAPSHVKRDLNQWADELTHPDYREFNPDKRLDVASAWSQFPLVQAVLEEDCTHWNIVT